MILMVSLLATLIMVCMVMERVHADYGVDIHGFNSYSKPYKKIILIDSIQLSSTIWKAAITLLAIAAVPVVMIVSLCYYLKTMVTVLWETKD